MRDKILIVLIFIFIPSISFAISGACSSHGGVNCSVISAVDDNAICSDSWVSSVPYNQIDECKQTTGQSFCIAPTSGLCATESDYGVMEVQGARSGAMEYGGANFNQTLTACRSSIISYQTQQLAYQTCINSAYVKPTPTLIYPKAPPVPAANGPCLVDQQTHDQAVKDADALTTKMLVDATNNLNAALNRDSSNYES